MVAERKKFDRTTYRGEIDAELTELIIGTVKESPTANKKMLEDFGIL